MDILRRNTDYALRAMLHLAAHWQRGPISVRKIASQEDISYQMACKIMHRLHKVKLVLSSSGPTGGFELRKHPKQTRLVEIIDAIQGPVSLSRCLLRGHICARSKRCPIRIKLSELKKHIDNYFSKTTLHDLLKVLSKDNSTKYRR